jgi:hypothetical protein
MAIQITSVLGVSVTCYMRMVGPGPLSLCDLTVTCSYGIIILTRKPVTTNTSV